MVYSRRLFYSRKYANLYILIFLILFIFLQIFQFNLKCSKARMSRGFGYQKTKNHDSITEILSLSGGSGKIDELLDKNENPFYIDESIKNNYFAFIYHLTRVLFTRQSRLEKMSQKPPILAIIYNSTNGDFSVSLTSRVIAQLKCNIRSINTSKYHISPREASAFTIIDDFSAFQAETNEKLHLRFDKYLQPDQSALASGTLIGAQSTISPKFKDSLISTGLIHVVVASGYNLTVVTGIVQSVARRVLPKRSALLLSLASVWWYVFLALCNTAILRAGWMCSISLFASLCGRPKSIWRVLILSILFLLAWDPTLITNISFQLSVFSTIGVLMINRNAIEESTVEETQFATSDKEQVNYAKNQAKKCWPFISSIWAVLKENFQTTVGANLFTLPITLFWFGRISVIALISNTLLLWIIPFVMYASSIFLVASQFSSLLAAIAALPIMLLANLFLVGVYFFASLPFAAFDVPKITMAQLIGSYAILFFVFLYVKPLYSFLILKLFPSQVSKK